MELATQIFQFILSISILVILHELGHFLPAKWFKCRVDKFYLFFDPWFSLAKKKIGETEYGIGWLPFGGYVKIAGMVVRKYGYRTTETTCSTLGIQKQTSLAKTYHHVRWYFRESYFGLGYLHRIEFICMAKNTMI